MVRQINNSKVYTSNDSSSSSLSSSSSSLKKLLIAMFQILLVLFLITQHEEVKGQIFPLVAESSIYKNAIIMPPPTSKFEPKFALQWEEITSASTISTNYLNFHSQCALGTDKIVKTSDIDNINNNLNNGLKVIKWKLTVGVGSNFHNALFGFSDGSANGWTKMKNVMSNNAAYSSTVNGKWSTSSSTTSFKTNFYSSLVYPPQVYRFDKGEVNTRPNLQGYASMSSLNMTFYDMFSGSKLLYNNQAFLSSNSKNALPLVISGDLIDAMYNSDPSNATIAKIASIREGFRNEDDLSYLYGPDGTSSIGGFLRSRSQSNWTDMSSTPSDFVVLSSYENYVYGTDFYFTTTNCFNDLVNSNSTSGNELYFFVSLFNYYTLLSSKFSSRIDNSYNNNVLKMFLAFNMTQLLTTPNGNKMFPTMMQSSSSATTPSFKDSTARYFISEFHYNTLTTYQQLRYLRTTHVFFYGLIIMTILFMFRKQQPVKSRFMINASVCGVAIFYGLFGIIMAAAVPDYDGIVSAAEVLFYLVLGFLYVLSAVRYFFSRNLYRTMRINFSKEKKKKEKKDSDTFEEKQLKLLRLLANLASWKVFLVGVIAVVVLIAGLSIFILVSILTGAADNFTVSISQVATYVKLAGLLGLVFPTAIISIILDASINFKRIFRKGGLKWYLIQDDPLLFRAEFAVFIPTVCLGVLLFGLDQFYNGLPWWDLEQKAATYLGHGLVYTVFEVSLLLLGCGGFIVIVQTIQTVRIAIRRGSLFDKSDTDVSKSKSGGLGLGEKTEFELFMESVEARAVLKQYCESEFSLENYLLFELVEDLHKLVLIEQTQGVLQEPVAKPKPKQLLTVQHSNSFRMSGDFNGASPSGLQPNTTTNSGAPTTITPNGLLNPADNTSMTTSFTSSGSEVVFLNNEDPTSPTSPSTISEPYSPSKLSTNGPNKEKDKNKGPGDVTLQIDRMIVKILKTYLSENSVLEVNLPNTTRKQVLHAFRKRVYPDDMSKTGSASGSKNFDKSPRSQRPDTDKKPESIDVEILAILKQDVWLNLKDTFGRLQLTNEYQLLKKKQALEKELNVV
ncbi:hypothetical protein NAEGRDRAFT_78910 [Naegleria gruberi]|uniref:RGS domain-containing protein n=1 Tax=Naegleria gruberi TaxID=5762 RepID=D2V7K5_NAEGR|nr:uncharacterized protein NAEGRDRAFT_78910 [Naegleria gruberi]EFC47266.1 hypothetical protein NAEGRDRAFT_78910 [Naegleria gruberi]|eukprot:XP_002680010.1 hypothetical protein NAEGRDRAFT_78910 [Naegleria gruberi strain NEG-M]